MVNGYIIALVVLVAWTALLFYLKKKDILQKYNMSNWGPFIMWRTQKGKDLIERLSRPKRFWNGYAALSKAIVVVTMAFMVGLLVWEAFLVSRIPAESAPGPEMMLGLPGINPLIPIWYGILGLVIAIVVHEYAHGILTRVSDIAVKSLGLVFVVFPMGAFVEPDEEAISKTARKKRMNIYAVGPATNIILAFLFAFLFASVAVASVEPVDDGPVVLGVLNGSPADMAGIGYGYQVLKLNGVYIDSIDSWYKAPSVQPGDNVTLTYYYKGEEGVRTVTSGLILTGVSSGRPAYEAGMRSGMMIVSLNNTPIRNDQDLKDALDKTQPGQRVNVTVWSFDPTSNIWYVEEGITNVTLDSKLQYYKDNNIAIPEDFKDIGFLGINSAYLGISVMEPKEILAWLRDPYDGVTDAGGFFQASLRYIALPFYGLAPVESPLTDLFQPTGMFEWMGAGMFWTFSNCLYWIFWINLMVGLTNALPAVPMDGGVIFKDGLDGLIMRFKKNATEEERKAISARIGKFATFIALFILFLIIWQMIGPRILG
ncbi:MAG: site-2 protease family protein [Methanomassiliicoccales archaeon]|nr:MAG: site-2 protease family protein [Methanomassiliicoccales archaeon]